MDEYFGGGGMIGAVMGFGFAVILLVLAITVVVYVLSSLAYCKALKAMGYADAWLGWIPYIRYLALAESTGADNVDLFGSGTLIPMRWFRFWWALALLFTFLPAVGSILSTACTVVCLGWTLTKVYACIDGESEDDVRVLAYISSFISIIAIVKFLTIKEK